MQLHQAGELEPAAREYQACAAAEPNRFEIRANYGVVLAGLGRFQEAIEQYRAAMKLAAPEAADRVRLNLGLAYYKSAQLPEAISEFRAIHDAHPGEPRVALLLGDCYLQTGKFSLAIELLKPLTVSPEEQDALDYELGMALIRGGHPAEGQVYVDRILRRGDSAEGHFLLGSALFMDGNYPAAVQELGKAAALNPRILSLQSYYGRALLFTGDADSAAEAFRRELALNPNDFDANFQLAAILSERGKADEARPLLERAVELRPTSAEARAALEHGFHAAGSADPGVPVGAPAPAIAQLEVARPAKPTVLVFGSYTCPKLRYSAAELKKAWTEFHDRADFRLVYIKEAHAEGDWQSTINQKDGIDLPPARSFQEKRAHAELCVRKLSLPFTSVVVDGMDGAAEKAYSAWPSRVYIVGRDGRVAFDSRLGEQDFHPAEFEASLREILSGRGNHGGSR